MYAWSRFMLAKGLWSGRVKRELVKFDSYPRGEYFTDRWQEGSTDSLVAAIHTMCRLSVAPIRLFLPTDFYMCTIYYLVFVGRAVVANSSLPPVGVDGGL